MRLTDKTDYSLRVLIYLMQKENKATIQEIADYFKISKNHLRVVVNDLARLGLILTMTGPSGGIVFNEKSSNFLLGDLFQKLEDLTIVECFTKGENSCAITKTCKLKHALKKANESFLNELNQYSLKDLR